MLARYLSLPKVKLKLTKCIQFNFKIEVMSLNPLNTTSNTSIMQKCQRMYIHVNIK